MTDIYNRIPQNTTVIAVGYVAPNQSSKLQVGPGVYSLNKRSNVPFVSFVGSAGFRKTISWGELAEIPAGQLVTVWNSSYHGGDIFINKGGDLCNRPSRITVPVAFTTLAVPTPVGNQDAWTPLFPCDTRGAKRAYLNMDAYVNPNIVDGLSALGGVGLTVFVRGRRLDGSMQCANALSQFGKPYGPGVGFLCAIEYGIFSDVNYVPLGQGAGIGDDTRPHNLLDAGDVFFLLGVPDVLLSNVFVWPADRNVFAYPEEQAAAPGTWYVIEYD